MPIISIVIPLYNASKYLPESIQSLQNQNFTDYELICIDDCSDDSTFDILSEYAQRDSRVSIYKNDIHQGAANTRNRGAELAKGEYIIFLDGDDFFCPDMLGRLINTAEKNSAEIVYFDYVNVSTEKIKKKVAIRHGQEYLRKYSDKCFDCSSLAGYEIITFHPCTWNKLYRRDLLQDLSLKFQDLDNSNDVSFSFLAFLLARKIVVLNSDEILIRIRNHNETSRISKNRNPRCTIEALEYIKNDLLMRSMDEQVNKFYPYIYFSTLVGEINKLKIPQEREQYLERLRCELLSFGNGWSKIYTDYKRQIDNGVIDFVLYLFGNKEKIRKKFECRNQVYVWGSGKQGAAFLHFCKMNNLHVSGLVDGDVSKHGMIIDEFKIQSPDSLDDDCLVFFTPFLVTGMPQNVVKKLGDRVIDINRFIGYI